MQLSYWEYKTWLKHVDITIIGSGIVGLNCALQLRKNYPKAKIVILESGTFPQGASTKNAGFACFGSVSELVSDLQTQTPEQVFNLVLKRVKGLQLLKKIVGEKAMQFQNYGGYEIFLKKDKLLYTNCLEEFKNINELLFPIFQAEVFQVKENLFSFQNIQKKCLFNPFEGQIDTGKLMDALLRKAQKQNIKILNAITLQSFQELGNKVALETSAFPFSTKKLGIATNGFAKELLPEAVEPARAQVLVTHPIKNLELKGTFHIDRGYYYFRNIDSRILLGGGRNLDFKTETTTQFGQTQRIQNALENLLREVILPKTPFTIDQRWSGIMGVGTTKSPIVKRVSENVFCGVRLGGMGIAIGSSVGKDLANLVVL